jgi:hypothetical protein
MKNRGFKRLIVVAVPILIAVLTLTYFLFVRDGEVIYGKWNYAHHSTITITVESIEKSEEYNEWYINGNRYLGFSEDMINVLEIGETYKIQTQHGSRVDFPLAIRRAR